MEDIEEIYKKYFTTVYKYLLSLTQSSDIAEELTQETFYRAVKNINKFKGNCKISVWLCQIAKNLWFDELRKNKRYKNIDDEEIIFQENLEEKAILNNDKIDLFKKIQKLDAQTRDVMYLRLTGELSFKEIASILNKTETWARVTFYRGKQKIKEVD